MNRDERRRRILGYCDGGYKPLKPLLNEIPKSSLYRDVSVLVRDGYLDERGKEYKTTQAGLRDLEDWKVFQERDWKILEGRYPVLRYIPTKQQRAVVELILAAIVARRDEARMDHHPTFILFGATLKWKTWVAKFICYVLGLDPAKNIVLATSESGRSILTRKGYRGKTIYRRGILSSSFVCFDEFHAAELPTKRLCSIYLQGEKRVSYENDVLDIECVPLITLNPKEGENLTERIGFEDPQIRRSILCNVDDVVVPTNVRMKGEEILEKVRREKPINFPTYRNSCFEYKDAVYSLIENCIREDVLSLIDIDTLLLLCSGMTAFLNEERAVAQVLYDYMTVIETLGWTEDRWYECLCNYSHSLMKDKERQLPEYKAVSLSLHESVKEILEVSKVNRPSENLDYDQSIVRTKEMLEDVGVTEKEARTILKDHKKYRSRGFTTDELDLLSREVGQAGLERTIEGIREYGTLEKTISSRRNELMRTEKKLAGNKKETESQEKRLADINARIEKLGSTPERFEETEKYVMVLKKQGIDETSKLEEWIEDNEAFEKIGFDSDVTRKLADEYAKRKKMGREKAVREIVSHIDKSQDLGKRIAHKNEVLLEKEEKLKDLDDRIGKSKEHVEKLSTDILNLKMELSDLKREIESSKMKKEEILNEMANVLKIEAKVRNVLAAKEKLVEENTRVQKRVREGKEKLRKITNERQELEDEIALMDGWRTFLFSGEIPSYDPFWRDLADLFEMARGEIPYPETVKNEVAEEVRKRLLELYRENIDGDVIPDWEHQKEVATLRRLAEDEKTELIQKHETEMRSLIASSEKEMKLMSEEHQREISDLEAEIEKGREEIEVVRENQEKERDLREKSTLRIARRDETIERMSEEIRLAKLRMALLTPLKTRIDNKKLTSRELAEIVVETYSGEIEKDVQRKVSGILSSRIERGEVIVTGSLSINLHCTSCSKSFPYNLNPKSMVSLIEGVPVGPLGLVTRKTPVPVQCPYCRSVLRLTLSEVVEALVSDRKR
ncbi:MAG: hypothetical protein ACE5IO_02665 [Thermoplasmata archaeon]